MLADDILIEIFGFFDRFFLERIVRYISHRTSTIVIRYLTKKPYFILNKLSVNFYYSTAVFNGPFTNLHLHVICTFLKELSIIPEKCCKLADGEFWTKFLNVTRVPPYLRVKWSEFILPYNDRSQYDIVTTIGKLQTTWDEWAPASISLQKYGQDNNTLIEALKFTTAPNVQLNVGTSFFPFLATKAIRQCASVEFVTSHLHVDEAEYLLLAEWLHGANLARSSFQPPRRTLRVRRFYCSRQLVNSLKKALIEVFISDDQMREFELHFVYGVSQGPITAQFRKHEKADEFLQIDDYSDALYIQRKLKIG